MLKERQQNILKLIVQEYIKLAKPVGSKQICKKLKCSSATIRNEMAELEELGLLEKTHTSSGRVPSEKGYRYYVDNLMELKEMNAEDMLKLQIIFKNNSLELADSINKSLELISDMTNYTSIVLGKASHENKLKQIEVVPINEESLIVVVITDLGHVQHKNITINNISLEEIKKTVQLINELIIGTPIDEVSSKLEFEVKPIIGRYVKEHEMLYNVFYNVFNDITNKNINIVRKENILKHQEFNNMDKIKELFTKLDEDTLINEITTNNSDINVYIGQENNLDKDVTIIQTTYKTSKDEGTIAIIGPKRMEYDRVVSLLEYIKENIENK